jgi:UDPglucose 6-dehydrogenase
VAQADAVLILTEWTSFAELNWHDLAGRMRKPAWLFDARSIADLAAAQAAGLQVWRVGCG